MKRAYLIIAIFAGFVSVLPYFLAYRATEPVGGERLHFLYQDSELVYLTRIREITEGDIHIASPFFYEYKDTPGIQQPFGEWLYALATIGNQDLIMPVVVASKFFLPILLFIILYHLIREILSGYREGKTVNRVVAIAVSTLVVLGYELSNVGFLREIIANTYNSLHISVWTRLVNPITGAIGFFTISYLSLTFHKKNKSLRIIFSGLILGVMSGYIFSFALGMVLFGCMLTLALVERNWVKAKDLFFVMTIALIINTHYLISIFTSSENIAALSKNGLLLTHNVLHNKALYLAGIVFVLSSVVVFYLKQRSTTLFKSSAWQWSASAIVAGLICLNQQVLTGKTVWPGHFVQYTNPIAYIVFFTSIFLVLCTFFESKSLKAQKIFYTFVTVGSVLGVLGIFLVNILATQSIESYQARYQDSQRYAPLLEWLEQQGGQCVVFVAEQQERIEKYITAYTPCDLYHSIYVFSGIPTERIMHNYLVNLRLFGVSEKKVEKYLDSHEHDMTGYFFEDWVDMFSFGNDHWVFNTKSPEERARFLPEAKRHVVTEYKKLENQSTDTLLKKYAINYIVFDRTYDTLDPNRLGYPIVFETNGLVVMKVN